MKKILICAACVLALFSSSALAQSSFCLEVPTDPSCRPGEPTGVSVTAGNGRLAVSWTTVSGATSYTLYYSQSPISDLNASDVRSVSATGTSVAVTGLLNGTQYYVVVTATNAGGEGAASTEVYATPQGTTTDGGDPEPTPPPPEPTPPPPEPTPPGIAPDKPKPDRHTNIFFANGVGNSPADAEASRALLEGRYKFFNASKLYPGTYSFHTAYNPTFGKVADVDETLVQKYDEIRALAANPDVQELRDYLLRRILDYWIARARRGDPAAAGRVRELLERINPPLTNATINTFTPSALRELAKTLRQQRIKGLQIDGSRLGTGASHAGQYSISLRKGNRVFVVSHSQGNLFTNVALQAVAGALPACERSLEQIGVATPAMVQFRHFYRTGTDDGVINGLRRILTVLRPNVTNVPGRASDPIINQNHAFIGEYMKITHQSFTDIDARMKRIAKRTPFPKPWPPPPPSCS